MLIKNIVYISAIIPITLFSIKLLYVFFDWNKTARKNKEHKEMFGLALKENFLSQKINTYCNFIEVSIITLLILFIAFK